MISIVIPTLNEEKALPILLNSIFKQSYKDYEIIVADYNSKDNTKRIARSYGCKIVRGGTMAVGRNNGAKAAKNDYILFLDSDVILKDKKYLEKIVKNIEKSKIDYASCKAVPSDGGISDRFIFGIGNVYVSLVQYISPHIWGPSMVVSKDFFKKVGGFRDNNTWEDQDFALRASKKRGKFRVFPVYFFTSIRRFKQSGYLKIILKYAHVAIHKLLFNEILPFDGYLDETDR